MILLTLALALASLRPAAAETIPYGRIIDLTQPLEAKVPSLPGELPGTHVDAPAKLGGEGKTVDQLPLDRRLVGKFVVVDVTRWAAKNAVYQARVSDFTDWEKYHGRLPEGTIVLVRTGFARRWPDREAYLGTRHTGKEARDLLRFPGLHPSAAKWLVEQRQAAAVGIDSASVDYGLSRKFDSKRILLSAGLPIFENVGDLSALPETGGWLFALPLKAKGLPAAPARLIAVLP